MAIWLRRSLVWASAVFFLGVALFSLLAYATLRASLPQLEGQRTVPGLTGIVLVERDGLGVPAVSARTREDLARATGFLHAQERFFQMDLSRRMPAGELAVLFGRRAAGADRKNRLHRLREVSRQVVARLDERHREITRAYVEGVNAGLAGLAGKPFEYHLLGTDPAPWSLEDSVLVAFALYMRLHDEYALGEEQRGLLRDALPAGLAAFLDPPGTRWDAPLVGEPFEPPAIPGPEVFDLRGRSAVSVRRPGLSEWEGDEAVWGSNNWAVSGDRTADGVAVLANDMHLGISVPNTWYRMRLLIPAVGEEAGLDVTGVTLPGLPAVLAGSNGHIAWGYTNSYGDWVDRVIVSPVDQDPSRYRTAAGPRDFETVVETIEVKDDEPVDLTIRTTIWGPVVQAANRELHALHWLAHDPEGANLNMLGLERAASAEEAVALAARIGAPPQNFVVADSRGNIAWTIMGRIPRRSGYDPRVPSDWTRPGSGWIGWLDPREYPRLVNPGRGALWTANARVADGEALDQIGDGGYDLGARARQIRDSLLAMRGASETDMLAIQLDDRALFLTPWRKILLELLDQQALADNPDRAVYRQLVEAWIPRASVAAVGYRLVRAFRARLLEEVYVNLTAPVAEQYPEFDLRPATQFEGALWQLVSERPGHLLPRDYQSWRAWMLAVVDGTIDYFADNYDGDLGRRSWGERNTVHIGHPLSGALGFAGRWLDMPRQPLPGDSNMPRAQGVSFGASERFAVSPGREQQGYFHMPAGQSGHPLSPFYASGHEAWVAGRPLPFLPGPAVYRLELRPGEQPGSR